MNYTENPLYLQVREQLLQRFLEMDIQAGDKLPTEAAMAEKLSVSRATVKRAFSQLADEQLIERQMGSGTYVLPAMVALRQEMLASKKPRRVAFVLPELTDRHSYHILRGVCRQAEEYKDDLELYNTFGSAAKEQDALRRVQKAQADGLLLWPALSHGENDMLRELSEKKLPIVLIDHQLTGWNCHCIMSDHIDAGRRATRYLLERGHQQIGFIATWATLAPSQQERLQGYHMAFAEKGLTAAASLQETHLPPSKNEQLEPAIIRYFEERPQLTAVICSGGLLMRVVKILGKLGKRVPDDVSLVCFDGFENSRYAACPPTYIQQPEKEMGQEAVNLLHRLFRMPKLNTQILKFPIQLVEGTTVRDLRDGMANG